jgi:hypothetical protein
MVGDSIIRHTVAKRVGSFQRPRLLVIQFSWHSDIVLIKIVEKSRYRPLSIAIYVARGVNAKTRLFSLGFGDRLRLVCTNLITALKDYAYFLSNSSEN